MSDDRQERRRRRRARWRASRTLSTAKMRPIAYSLPIYELLDEDGLERLHQASMRILSEFGVDFLDEEVRAILKENGVKVQGDTAFFDPGLIEEHLAHAPSQFTQLARNPDNHVLIGGNQIVFAPVYGPPFVLDLEGGRRQATLADFQNFVKLAYLSPYMHHSGGTIVRHHRGADRRAGSHAAPGYAVEPHQVQRQSLYGVRHFGA
jgi:trimethylamine--corrinoid protein Co-methyltransferase